MQIVTTIYLQLGIFVVCRLQRFCLHREYEYHGYIDIVLAIAGHREHGLIVGRRAWHVVSDDDSLGSRFLCFSCFVYECAIATLDYYNFAPDGFDGILKIGAQPKWFGVDQLLLDELLAGEFFGEMRWTGHQNFHAAVGALEEYGLRMTKVFFLD